MPREDGLPPGTLVMLVLRVLAARAAARLCHRTAHPHAVPRRAERRGGLPLPGAAEAAAQGLGQGVARDSETGRAVREYPLTPAGRKQLELERANYRRVTAAIGAVLESA